MMVVTLSFLVFKGRLAKAGWYLDKAYVGASIKYERTNFGQKKETF